mmetsp:Transcript_28509/g.43644  ORF Transcript_28509/g.43644 Transcript_28509/m.43644 type:complete len:585 (-) Transcript_28509:2173-3927(-)
MAQTRDLVSDSLPSPSPSPSSITKKVVDSGKDLNIDALIEQTTKKMDSVLEISDTVLGSRDNITSTATASSPYEYLLDSTSLKHSKRSETTTASNRAKKLKGILKQSNTNSKALDSDVGTRKMASIPVNNDTLAEELGLPKGWDNPNLGDDMNIDTYLGEKHSVTSFVKDQVMERSVNVESLQRIHDSRFHKQERNFDPTQVEGHASSTYNVPKMEVEEKNSDNPESINQDELESLPPPKIIKSLAELVAYAEETKALHAASTDIDATAANKSGVHSKANDGTRVGGTDTDTTIETNMEFSYMAPDEFENINKEAATLGIPVEELLTQRQQQQDEAAANEREEDICNSEEGEESFQMFEDEDDNDEGDIFDFFGGGELDEEDEISPPLPLRPFMMLWNAIAIWITPDAVEILRSYRKELFDGSEHKVVSSSSQACSYGLGGTSMPGSHAQSDIGSSRCSGLMTMLKMNIGKSMSDLGYNSDDGYSRRIAETRLYEFIKTFDYTKPMIKFKSDMWRALTVILLDIILPKHDIAYEGIGGKIVVDRENPRKNIYPTVLKTVGITEEEYDYLVSKAIPTLQVGGGGS